MFEQARAHYASILDDIRQSGLWKEERIIESPQADEIRVGGRTVINFCANNYLGLSSHPAVIEAARASLDERGYGLSSVRFICGTQDRHKELEAALSRFVGSEDTILYTSCFDANGGLFETLLGEEDAVISDSLNHASVIDGIRLCKAERHRFEHDDLDQLESMLKATASRRIRMIATDGVFSMDGDVARLAEICDLADRHGALSWWTTATPPASWARPARHPRAPRRHGPGRHHHVHPRQGAGAAPRAASPAPGARSWISCAIAAGRTSSPTPWRRRSWPAAWPS